MMIDFWFFAIILVVLFLLGKAVWQDSESFKLWKWKRNIRIKNLKGWQEDVKITLWEKLPELKTLYILTAVIVFIPLVALFFIFYFQIGFFLLGKETGGIREIAFAFFGTISGLAGLFGVYLAILRSETTERQTRTAEEGLITDRINKATEGLGKKDDKEPVIEVRLGALYALERIAQDSIRDHIQIIEILCAYIRTNSPLKSKQSKAKKLREDIQAALTIIGRRGNWQDGKKHLKKEQQEGYNLDLQKCNLRGAQLQNANLQEANLNGTILRDANLNKANLNEATIEYADMQDALCEEINLKKASINNTTMQNITLNRARLNNASLDNTDLNNAQLNGADMRNASLNEASLNNASLIGANMHYTKLNDTDMNSANTKGVFINAGDFSDCKNLKSKQIYQMFCGTEVTMPSSIKKRPEHWPKNRLLYKEFKKAYRVWIKKEFLNDFYMHPYSIRWLNVYYY